VRTALRAGGAKTPLPAGLDEKWWSPALGSTDFGPDEGPHPGFARWDLGVAVRIAPTALVDVAVDNVLDARYLDRPEVGAYPQPGRSLRLRLTLGEE
jgi:outer membrane receptor protein involved in Fe transport